eukprot:gene1709-16188_t
MSFTAIYWLMEESLHEITFISSHPPSNLKHFVQFALFMKCHLNVINRRLVILAGPSQVKWNKTSEYLFASTHDGDVRVWDTRKGNIPLAYIAAHLSKIHGLDWSFTKENSFVTASNDSTVKFWNVHSPKQAKASLSTGAPVWRARYTPFGDGLLTVVVPSLRRDENNLHLWHCYDLSSPVHTFSGHQDVILEFQWRSREIRGQIEYQLVTWSKDQTIKIWAVSPKVVKACSEHPERHHSHRSMESTTSPHGSPPLSSQHKPMDHENKKVTDEETISVAQSFADTSGDFLQKHPVEIEFESRHENPPHNELQKEFDLININNPIVSFEKKVDYRRDVALSPLTIPLDAKQRVCVVSAKIGHHLVSLNITFPPAYPNNVPPNFRFSKETNVDHDLRSRLMKALLETANAHVKYNRTCLEPCVRQLIQQIEELSMRYDLLDSILTVPHQLPSFFPRRDASASLGSYQDPAVPFPRFSGARFCGVDKLVIFTRPAMYTHVNSEGSDITLRSISALPTYISNMTVEESFDTSVFEKDVSAKGMQRRSSGVVVISDISALLPIQKSLAKECVINGPDVGEICRVNVNAAKLLGRADLVRTWSLVAMVMEKYLEPTDNIEERPWARHPFGKRLIESLFNYYSQIRDVQTMALLSCVLSRQRLPHASNSSPTKMKKGYTITDISQVLKRQRTSLQECQVQVSPDFPYGIYRSSSTSSAAGSMSPPAFIVERSESTEDFKFEYRKSCRLLDPSITRQYDCLKRAYADILYRWNLLNKRAEVLKHIDEVPSPHRGLGLLSFCVACGHGGHTLHLMGWFQKMDSCATGCGCFCLKNGSVVSDEEYLNSEYY